MSCIINYMTLTKDDIRLIGEIVVEVTAPMFEELGGRISNLEDRVSSLEDRMSSLELELKDFKSEVRTRLSSLEERIDHMSSKNQNIFNNIDEDIRFIYHLIEKLEKGSAAEKKFAKQTIVEHLPAIYKAVVLVAKDLNVPLPKADTIK